MHKHLICSLFLLAVGAGAGYYYKTKQVGEQLTCSAGILNENRCALRRGMASLWAEHVFWTRQFIVSSLAGLPDASVAAERLLKNQDALGAAIVPFYGQAAGDELAKLLREHINIAAAIVGAAMAKDDAKVQELNQQWQTNAETIAVFLSTANQHWTKDGLESMLKEHLALTAKELQLRMQADWAADAANFDEIFKQAEMMSQELADGIFKQFSDKF